MTRERPYDGDMSEKEDDIVLDNPQLDLAAESFDTDSVNFTDGEDLQADLDAPIGTDEI